ncbi:hypothetical protein ACLB2K_029669 [Fragaria x ananassa]
MRNCELNSQLGILSGGEVDRFGLEILLAPQILPRMMVTVLRSGFFWLLRARKFIDAEQIFKSILADGDSRHGEIRRSTELVQEMASRGIKPSVITSNTMLDACAETCNYLELDLKLHLMEKEEVAFDVKTYEFLIYGVHKR